MYPITPIGRILSCLCALFGAATMGMLISVLVDRYQRVYKRKKFLPQDEASFIETIEDQNHQTEDIILTRTPSKHPQREKCVVSSTNM